MKIFDLALNALIILSAMLFLAYIGYHYFDFGLFKTLPENIASVFLSLPALQYVALAILVAAVAGKIVVGRRLKAERMQREN